MDHPRILDQQGNEQDWDWFVANFGPMTIEQAPASSGKVYRIIMLRDSEGPSVQLVQVRDSENFPLIGVNVARHWPDAPTLPDWPAPISRWRNRGVFGPTNPEGNTGFGMGHGDYYFAPNCGASAVWVADARGPSDLIAGLGMLGGTNHRHVDVVFQLVDLDATVPIKPPAPVEPPAEPPPSDEQFSQMLAKLDRIIELLEQLAA